MGDRCFVQNQTGPAPNRWDRTGIIIEAHPHDQFTVKIDGSGRLTTRNRKFLRYFQPASMDIQPAPDSFPLFTNNDPHNPSPNPLPDIIGIDKKQSIENQKTPLSYEPQTQDVDLDTIPHIHDDAEINEPPIADQTVNEPKRQADKIPTLLKRLLPHNKEGLKEDIKLPDSNSRCLRSRVVNGLP